MATLTLKTLLRAAAVSDLARALGVGIEDGQGATVLGTPGPHREPVTHEDATLGWVTGPPAPAAALAALLTQLAAKEAERRALAGEVLHLYREVHLIDQLSEQLAALLDLKSVGQAALNQARRLISGSSGAIHALGDTGLRVMASFGETEPLPPADLIDRGVAQILNGLISAPLRAKQRTVGTITLAGATYSSADLKLLNTIALQTAAAIENSLLCAEMVDAVRDREQLAALQKELDTARIIQHSLVPRIFPPFPERTDFDIHAEMTSAKAVGGDFFDFFLIDPDRLAVVIGDVSGKGVPAALYMAVTRTQIKTTALQGMSPADCLLEVNRGLVREKVSSMFATCFYGVLKLSSGEFHYCNAGHNPPYLLRATGLVEPLPITGGMPLGMFAKLKCTNGTVSLGDGDAVFLYTDGVTEATTATLDDFTDERLVASLRAAGAEPCRNIVERVTRDVIAFTAGAPQSDDITVLAVRKIH